MAGAAFGDVGASLFVAGAAFGDVGASVFVAGATFGEVGMPLLVAGARFRMLECHFSWQAQYLGMLKGDSRCCAHS